MTIQFYLLAFILAKRTNWTSGLFAGQTYAQLPHSKHSKTPN